MWISGNTVTEALSEHSQRSKVEVFAKIGVEWVLDASALSVCLSFGTSVLD